MSSSTIRDTIDRVLPSWLRGFWGSRLLYALSVPWDALVDASIEAMEASLPGYRTMESLPYLAHDRKLSRGMEETDAAFAERLRLFRRTHSTRGGARALLRQLRAYLTGHAVKLELVNAFGTRWIVDEAGVESFAREDSPHWFWDYAPIFDPLVGHDVATATHLEKFWVLIHAYQDPTLIQAAGTIGDDHPFGVGTLGTNWPEDRILGLRALIADWSAAHTVCAKTILIFDQADWEANQPLHGDWVYCGARCHSAAYLDGTP